MSEREVTYREFLRNLADGKMCYRKVNEYKDYIQLRGTKIYSGTDINKLGVLYDSCTWGVVEQSYRPLKWTEAWELVLAGNKDVEYKSDSVERWSSLNQHLAGASLRIWATDYSYRIKE